LTSSYFIIPLFSFQIIIVADDQTVWMMGATKSDGHELDAPAVPLQVETDFVTVEEVSAIHQEGIKNNQHRQSPVYLRLESDDLITTGYKKISLHRKRFYQRDPLSNTSYDHNDNHLLYQSFNFTYCKDEVYLVPILHDDLSTVSANEKGAVNGQENTKSPIKIIDYSEGWKHQLLVVETDENK
jgi:hypothetical protein